MRNFLTALGLALTAVSPAFAAAPTASPKLGVSGDYVEARTASVFAGACHYNGELTTTGKEVVMAWRFNQGKVAGVDVSGLAAMAAISSDANLQDTTAPRRAVLFLDSRATAAQQTALKTLLTTRYSKTFGTIIAVKPVAISFRQNGRDVCCRGPRCGRADRRSHAKPRVLQAAQPRLVQPDDRTQKSPRRLHENKPPGRQHARRDLEQGRAEHGHLRRFLALSLSLSAISEPRSPLGVTRPTQEILASLSHVVRTGEGQGCRPCPAVLEKSGAQGKVTGPVRDSSSELCTGPITSGV